MDDIVMSELVDESYVEVQAVVANMLECLNNRDDVVNLGLLDVADRETRPRNDSYFETTIQNYDDLLFKEHFRMTRSTCEELIIVISDRMSGRKDKYAALPKKVLFTIWLLAKPESFLACGDRFGFAKSTGHNVFMEILTVLVGLLSTYIKFPTRTQCQREALTFQRRSRGFPGIVGAIDGCHIPIKAPVGNANDFYNRKDFHSIILQGTCDHKMRFIDVFIGMPGRMHDARVFRNSEIFRRLNDVASPLLPPHLHLVGDTAYPLMRGLMKPFKDNGQLTLAQTNYNKKLSSNRCVIERSFALLKGKWRRLKFLDVSSPETAQKIVAASCVLHNFLLNRNEVDFESAQEEIDASPSVEDESNDDEDDSDINADISAITKRDEIVERLM